MPKSFFSWWFGAGSPVWLCYCIDNAILFILYLKIMMTILNLFQFSMQHIMFSNLLLTCVLLLYTMYSYKAKILLTYYAYIIVPMHPEVDPTSKPGQEILHWQHRTMEMMYKFFLSRWFMGYHLIRNFFLKVIRMSSFVIIICSVSY